MNLGDENCDDNLEKVMNLTMRTVMLEMKLGLHVENADIYDETFLGINLGDERR